MIVKTDFPSSWTWTSCHLLAYHGLVTSHLTDRASSQSLAPWQVQTYRSRTLRGRSVPCYEARWYPAKSHECVGSHDLDAPYEAPVQDCRCILLDVNKLVGKTVFKTH